CVPEDHDRVAGLGGRIAAHGQGVDQQPLHQGGGGAAHAAVTRTAVTITTGTITTISITTLTTGTATITIGATVMVAACLAADEGIGTGEAVIDGNVRRQNSLPVPRRQDAVDDGLRGREWWPRSLLRMRRPPRLD